MVDEYEYLTVTDCSFSIVMTDGEPHRAIKGRAFPLSGIRYTGHRRSIRTIEVWMEKSFAVENATVPGGWTAHMSVDGQTMTLKKSIYSSTMPDNFDDIECTFSDSRTSGWIETRVRCLSWGPMQFILDGVDHQVVTNSLVLAGSDPATGTNFALLHDAATDKLSLWGVLKDDDVDMEYIMDVDTAATDTPSPTNAPMLFGDTVKTGNILIPLQYHVYLVNIATGTVLVNQKFNSKVVGALTGQGQYVVVNGRDMTVVQADGTVASFTDAFPHSVTSCWVSPDDPSIIYATSGSMNTLYRVERTNPVATEVAIHDESGDPLLGEHPIGFTNHYGEWIITTKVRPFRYCVAPLPHLVSLTLHQGRLHRRQGRATKVGAHVSVRRADHLLGTSAAQRIASVWRAFGEQWCARDRYAQREPTAVVHAHRRWHHNATGRLHMVHVHGELERPVPLAMDLVQCGQLQSAQAIRAVRRRSRAGAHSDAGPDRALCDAHRSEPRRQWRVL